MRIHFLLILTASAALAAYAVREVLGYHPAPVQNPSGATLIGPLLRLVWLAGAVTLYAAFVVSVAAHALLWNRPPPTDTPGK